MKKLIQIVMAFVILEVTTLSQLNASLFETGSGVAQNSYHSVAPRWGIKIGALVGVGMLLLSGFGMGDEVPHFGGHETYKDRSTWMNQLPRGCPSSTADELRRIQESATASAPLGKGGLPKGAVATVHSEIKNKNGGKGTPFHVKHTAGGDTRTEIFIPGTNGEGVGRLLKVALGSNGIPLSVDTEERHSHEALTEGIGQHGAVTVALPNDKGTCYNNYQVPAEVNKGNNE